MKKQVLIVLLLVSAVLVACAAGKKSAKKGSGKSTTSSTATTSNKDLRGLTAVTMRRGACFGRCPEYTLTVNSTGLVEYNGTRNADPLGTYQKDIGTTKAQVLLKQFMDYRADTCRAYYEARIADLPGLSYTLVRNGKSQSIGNANFGPRYLVDLSEEMDAIGKPDATWKKIAGPKTD